MLRAAAPTTDIGFIIVGESTPDAVTYPELVRFAWLKASTGELRYYNGASWELIASNVSIAAGTVTSTMLSSSGGTAYQILAVNAAGTSVTFQNLASLLGTPTYATIGGYGSQLFLTVSGGVGKLSGVDPTAFLVKSVPKSKVSFGGTVGQMPYSDGAGGISWAAAPTVSIPDASITIAKLSSTGGSIGNSIRVKSGGGFEYYAPSAYNNIYAALLEYYKAANTDGDVADGSSPVKVPLNRTVYNGGTIVSSLAGTGIFTLIAGTYLIDAWLNIYLTGTAGSVPFKQQVDIRNETAGTTVKAVSVYNSGDDDTIIVHIKAYVAPGSPTDYSLRLTSETHTASEVLLGKAVNLNAMEEVYAQVQITKLL